MQLGHVAQIHDIREFLQVFRHPQADIRSAGQNQGLGIRRQRCVELVEGSGRTVTGQLQCLLGAGAPQLA